MSAPNGINLIFGAGGYGTYLNDLLGVDTARALVRDQLEVLSAEGVRSIDTSELYEGSEEELAHHDAAKKFIIHTKVKGGFAAGRTTKEIVEVGKERLRLLKTNQVGSALCTTAIE
jgi:diketogulonate reductase-like aldo/keto reductase